MGYLYGLLGTNPWAGLVALICSTAAAFNQDHHHQSRHTFAWQCIWQFSSGEHKRALRATLIYIVNYITWLADKRYMTW
eukprot:scaffold293605_cov29-Prasinocladus_malaysianus.AAC.1